MPNQQLIEYIKQARATGKSDAEIKSALLGAGWEDAGVDGGFAVVLSGSAQKSATSGKSKSFIVAASVIAALFFTSSGFAYWYFVYELKQQSTHKQTINQNIVVPKSGYPKNQPIITEDNEQLPPETAHIVSPLQPGAEVSKGITLEESSYIMLGPPYEVITQIADKNIIVRWPDTGEAVNTFRVYRKINNQQDWQWLGDIQVTEYNPDARYEFKDISPKQGSTYIYGIKAMYIPKTNNYIRESRIAESAPILFKY